MIHSMTGYAIVQTTLASGTLSVELRAVNQRFLDLTLRLPEELRGLEGHIRERIGAKVSRGKLECRVNFNAQTSATSKLDLNTALLQELLAVSAQARQYLPQGGDWSLGELLRWPGILNQGTPQTDTLNTATLALLDTALTDFNTSRAREGTQLKNHLLERVAGMKAIIDEVKPRIPQQVAAYETKLKTRLLEALGSFDDERLRQEIILFVQKIDVDEELSRLDTHLEEIHRILEKGGPAGKRLDFLMQELNREANTLGSKATVVENTQASIELKVLIEQMREQIQNIE